jgi:hypothetical protein
MSPLLEFDCQVPVGGYEVITVEKPYTEDDDTLTLGGVVVGVEKWRILQPRSERTRRVDLFSVGPSAFLEFAQTPDTPDAIKGFADRYGALSPDVGTDPIQYGRDIFTWSMCIRDMKKTIELWKSGDFKKLMRTVKKKEIPLRPTLEGVPVQLLLKEDPLSACARLCFRPDSLLIALYCQLLLKIDGSVNLGACVVCRKWFTLEAGGGRSDKEYCSDACRMRAYRKRKGSG